MSILRRALDGLAGALFLYSGILKVMDPLRFQLDLLSFPFFPAAFGFLVAVFLPWLEILAGTGLILHRLERGSRSILILLTAGFLIFILIAWQQGIDAACGCFGDSWVFPNWPAHFLFNVGLLAVLWPWGLRKQIAA